MLRGTEREHALLGTGLLLVASCPAESRIEAVLVECLLESLGLHDVGVDRRAVGERIDVLLDPFRVDVDDQLHTRFLGHLLAELIHLAKLPAGIHMQQWKRRDRRVKGLARQMQHDRTVLADGVEHYRIFGLGDDFAHDLNAFGFEALQMS